MEHGDRIPIDLGYEAASPSEAAAQQSIQRTTVKDDGTVVIDILAPPNCGEAGEGEIVVCASAPESGSAEDDPPAAATMSETINEALHVKIGPVELGSIDRGDGTRAFGARVRF